MTVCFFPPPNCFLCAYPFKKIPSKGCTNDGFWFATVWLLWVIVSAALSTALCMHGTPPPPPPASLEPPMLDVPMYYT